MNYRQALGPSEEQLAATAEQDAAAQARAAKAAEFQTSFDDPSYWGSGAGDYATWDPSGGLMLKDSSGGLRSLGRGEHAESNSYLQAAAADPNYDKFVAWANQRDGGLTPEQRQLMTLVGGDTWGQSLARGWGGIDPYSAGLTGHQAGTMLQTGYEGDLTPEQRSSGAHFNWYESPGQQSIRSDSGGLFGDLGDIGKLAMLAAAIYSGGTALGAFGAGEGAALAGAEIMGPAMESGFMSAADAAMAESAAMSSWAAEPPTLWNQATSVFDTAMNNPVMKGAKTFNNVTGAANSLNNMLNPPARPTSVGGLGQVAIPLQNQQQPWNPSFGNPLSHSIRGA
jgi:hypothetical protein